MIDQLAKTDARLIYNGEYFDLDVASNPKVEDLAREAKEQWPDIPVEFVMRRHFRGGWSVVWAFDGTGSTWPGDIDVVTQAGSEYQITKVTPAK